MRTSGWQARLRSGRISCLVRRIEALAFGSWSPVTAKEAAERDKRLRLGLGEKPRGFGVDPPADSPAEAYTYSQRIRDVTALFITQCARAYVEKTLSVGHPVRSKILAAQIGKAVEISDGSPPIPTALGLSQMSTAGSPAISCFTIAYGKITSSRRPPCRRPENAAKTKAQRRSERAMSRGRDPAVK